MQHAMTMTMSTTARWIDTGAQVLIGATAIVAACIALTGAGLRGNGDVPQGRFRMAMEAYEAQQWPQAYAQLSAAADAGDPAAARVATMMARQGPLLFGQHFDVSPERLQRWDRAMRGQAASVTSRETDARRGDSPPAVLVAGAR
ncbi:hypothetical protein [Scleromatobacter humisilvae]|uniref:Uncharacterized protein n=1 Tax=Scleromatobacter humisilvae TaxID=2897159 RepID=A0A9X1YML5_9BURK|nr:hypothetical protein [Scleromatobacter humisilvae]MCK9684306.1 hypothetical protein [Scleromatobacter humisilvae]